MLSMAKILLCKKLHLEYIDYVLISYIAVFDMKFNAKYIILFSIEYITEYEYNINKINCFYKGG